MYGASTANAYVVGEKNNLFLTDNFNIIHYNGETWYGALAELREDYPELKGYGTMYWIENTVFISMFNNDVSVIIRGYQQ